MILNKLHHLKTLHLSLVGEEHGKVGSASNLWFLYSLRKCEKNNKDWSLTNLYFPKTKKKVNWSTEPELKPIMKINFNNAAFSQYMYGNSFWRIGCIWLFCLLLLWPMLPSLHRKSFDNEEKGKKIMKLSYNITMLKARPRGYSLIETIQVWAGPKDKVVDPFMCEIGKWFPRFGKNR